MAADYQKWIKVASDLGITGSDLTIFVDERMAEVKAEKKRQEALAEKLAERELQEKIAERELQEKIAERESYKRRLQRELAEKERRHQEEQERRKLDHEFRMRELEVQREVQIDRQSHISGSRESLVEQVHERDTRPIDYAMYVKMPTFKENSDNLDAYLLRLNVHMGQLDSWVPKRVSFAVMPKDKGFEELEFQFRSDSRVVTVISPLESDPTAAYKKLKMLARAI